LRFQSIFCSRMAPAHHRHSAPKSPFADSHPPTSSCIEWPTWGVWLAIGLAWGGLIAAASDGSVWLVSPGLVLVLAWYMSLQHEVIHGHPTRSDRVNRWLVLAPLAVWYPYDLYRRSHLTHHQDNNLTIPGLDTESNYVTAEQAHQHSGVWRAVRASQRTVAGRFALGPALVILGLLQELGVAWRTRDRAVFTGWATHLALLLPLLWGIHRVTGLSAAWYCFGIAYPALGLAMLRSLYEHRPRPLPAHRIVINEASWFWRLLYLNNNYHAVHHAHPGLAWYCIPAHYLADREGYLDRNGGFLVPGYFWLIRRFAWRPIDSPVLGTTP